MLGRVETRPWWALFEWVGTAETSLASAWLLFGGLAALTRGLRVRTKEGIDDLAADREARVE